MGAERLVGRQVDVDVGIGVGRGARSGGGGLKGVFRQGVKMSGAAFLQTTGPGTS